MTGSGFDSTKIHLQELLSDAEKGSLQLPDFQRGWIWDDDRIKSLLASISACFPIGAVMLLETRGTRVSFKPRPLDGTEDSGVEPDTLVLDGQQRLTSLYQALMNRSPVKTRDSKKRIVYRRYYIDMNLANSSEADPEDALVSVPEGGQIKKFGGGITLDVTTPEHEFKRHLFPMNNIFRSADWRQAYGEYWDHNPVQMRIFNEFETKVIKGFEQYQIPVIKLKKETPKEAVCLVFERVNTGGVSLTVFELLTASFAADGFQLRDDWRDREKRIRSRYRVLNGLKSDDFLQAISLLVTRTRRNAVLGVDKPTSKAPGISCKRRDILNLSVADWQRWADPVEQAFGQVAQFLHGQKIFRAWDLPYRTQLVPLAAIFASLKHIGETVGAQRKIARWYWCGVLGELYGGTTESRFAHDLPEVVAYILENGPEPITVSESNFQPNRLLTLRTRNSSAYKGLYALLMKDGCKDFRTEKPIEEQLFFDESIDIHHIFPERWCKSSSTVGPEHYNSVINKTAISARTNRQIGGNKPSRYLRSLEESAGIDPSRMDEILASHCIEPMHLRDDDFWRFYLARAVALLKRIELATGKEIALDPDLFRPDSAPSTHGDGSTDWDDTEFTLEVTS